MACQLLNTISSMLTNNSQGMRYIFVFLVGRAVGTSTIPMMKICVNIDCWEAVQFSVERKETIKGLAVVFTHLGG